MAQPSPNGIDSFCFVNHFTQPNTRVKTVSRESSPDVAFGGRAFYLLTGLTANRTDDRTWPSNPQAEVPPRCYPGVTHASPRSPP